MSMCMAWVREKNDGDQELIVVTDSIFTGDGNAWENGVKLFELPRPDCLLTFVGMTERAYPLVLNLISSLKFNDRLKKQYTPLNEVVEHISELFSVLIKNIKDETKPERIENLHQIRNKAKFLFSGWCWRENRFKIWEISYKEGPEAFVFDEYKECSLSGLCAHIADPEEMETLATEKLKELIENLDDGKLIDMEPLKVLIEISRSPETSQRYVGGATQIAKIYRSGTSEFFGIYWPSRDGKPHFQGRKFEEYNKPNERYLDPDTLEIVNDELLEKINLKDFESLDKYSFILDCYDGDGSLKEGLTDSNQERLIMIFKEKAYKDFVVNSEVTDG